MKPSIVAFSCSIFCAILPSVAAADIHSRRSLELGLAAGWHGFGSHSELGVRDVADATPPDDGIGGVVRLGYWPTSWLSLEVEAGGLLATQAEQSVQVVPWRATATVELGGTRSFRPFVAAGWGALTLLGNNASLPPNDTDPAAHAGVGFRYWLTQRIALRFDGRAVLPPSNSSASVAIEPEAWLGVAVRLGGASRKPVIPKAKPTPAHEPAPVVPVAEPAPAPPPPEPPAPVDTDGDGIMDPSDACPDKAEIINGFEDTDGCPDDVPMAIAKFTGVMRGITFANNKAVIRRSSYKALNEAADVLTQFPAIRLEISGHTDNRGSAERNSALSLARAKAVKAYLVQRGIESARLQAVGHGPAKPLAPNNTAKGRAKNRRIEFWLLP